MTYLIEQGIPAPQTLNGRNRRWWFPLDDMQVGDSFLISSGDPLEIMACRKAMTVYHQQHPSQKLVSRKIKGGVRVWRIA